MFFCKNKEFNRRINSLCDVMQLISNIQDEHAKNWLQFNRAFRLEDGPMAKEGTYGLLKELESYKKEIFDLHKRFKDLETMCQTMISREQNVMIGFKERLEMLENVAHTSMKQWKKSEKNMNDYVLRENRPDYNIVSDTGMKYRKGKLDLPTGKGLKPVPVKIDK